jgi:diacylglycerol O-acyltransferase
MEPIPLTEEDRAILDLEGPTIVGHTCKVVRLAEPGVDLDGLRERVGQRLERAPVLRMRLGGEPESPSWFEDPGFDLSRHVGAAPVANGEPAGPLEPTEAPALVARLFAEHLDRTHPLWRIDHAALSDGGTLVVWRLHHALADGTVGVRLARELLWDEGAGAAPEPQRAGPGGTGHPTGDPDQSRRRGHLGLLAREFAESIHDPPFDGEVGRRREVAFANVPLAPLHDAAKALCRASVNDAVLTVVAGGVRSWLEHEHRSAGPLRFKVPVSLHHEGDDAGNRDSFFTLPVHLEEPDPVARLAEINAATSARKSVHDAERIAALGDAAEAYAPPLAALLRQLEASPRSFALCVSNVPGPRGPVRLAGSEVSSLHSLAEVGRRHGLRVAVVSLAGRLHFGICADPVLIDDLGPMVAGVEADAAALVAAADRQP